MTNFNPITGSRLPPYYLVALHAALDETAPDTTLVLATGICSDSTDTIDMYVESAITIDCATVGAAGLDTGVLVLNEVYYVHVIGDSSGYRVPSALVSLSIDDPIMPTGYDSFRMVDFKTTDADADFRSSFTVGAYSERLCVFEDPVTVHDTTGAAAFTAITLAALAPALEMVEAQFSATLTPIAANDTLDLRSTGATGSYASMSGSVIAVDKTTDITCLALANALGFPSVDFKTNAAGTAVAVIKLKSIAFEV